MAGELLADQVFLSPIPIHKGRLLEIETDARARVLSRGLHVVVVVVLFIATAVAVDQRTLPASLLPPRHAMRGHDCAR